MERERSITESLSRIEKRKEPTQTKLFQISERVRELKARKSLKKLDRKLIECMHALKAYPNVNKKALDQFNRASEQQEELNARVEELKRNEQSIQELLTVLDNRRFETLQLTFKQVAKNFREVFGRLIPNGHGDLVMRTEDQATVEEARQRNPELHVMETFVGIGIQVSFTGGDETREMSHLSGGQKSLVALALIFAIQ